MYQTIICIKVWLYVWRWWCVPFFLWWLAHYHAFLMWHLFFSNAALSTKESHHVMKYYASISTLGPNGFFSDDLLFRLLDYYNIVVAWSFQSITLMLQDDYCMSVAKVVVLQHKTMLTNSLFSKYLLFQPFICRILSSFSWAPLSVSCIHLYQGTFLKI